MPAARVANCVAEESLDVAIDGDVDRRTVYWFDAGGLPMLSRRFDVRGMLNVEVRYRFGDFGIESVTYDDVEPIGEIDFENVYEYDARGRLEGKTVRRGDGVTMAVSTYAYSEGPDGSTTAIGHDFGADGIVDEREMIQYSARGEEQRHEYDFDADGEADLSYTSIWDDGLLRRRLEEIVGGLEIYEYDAKRRIANQSEFTAAGELDRWATYRYDEHDYLRGIRLYYGESHLDAAPEYDYDSLGRVILGTDEVVVPPFRIRTEYDCR